MKTPPIPDSTGTLTLEQILFILARLETMIAERRAARKGGQS